MVFVADRPVLYFQPQSLGLGRENLNVIAVAEALCAFERALG